MAALILSVGRDATLLAIRNLLLSGAGYNVDSATGVDDFSTKFLGGDFDAVVLCHTVPADQRKRITKLAHAHSPSTPVVVMSNGPIGGTNGSSDDAFVFGDTRDLIRVLPEVVRSSHQRSPM